MNEKVILISIDGMRPDGVIQCGHPFIQELKSISSYTLQGDSVFPPVTLPCHISIFHSIPPDRHGIITNTYSPPVRPITSITDQLSASGKICAAFYNWEFIRDIWKPETMKYTFYIHCYEDKNSDLVLTNQALSLIKFKYPDFVFLHLVETDTKGGHDNGWMSPKYLTQLTNAISCAEKIIKTVGRDYHIIITSDHGGHDRTHGYNCPEDMIIPMFFYGKSFLPGQKLNNISLLDLAPTIASLIGVPAARKWEGHVIHHIQPK